MNVYWVSALIKSFLLEQITERFFLEPIPFKNLIRNAKIHLRQGVKKKGFHELDRGGKLGLEKSKNALMLWFLHLEQKESHSLKKCITGGKQQ